MNSIKGGEKIQKHTQRKLMFLTFTIIFTLAVTGAVSAAENPGDNGSIQIQSSDSSSSTNNSGSSSHQNTSNSSHQQALPDPQVWHNGVNVGNYTNIQDAINAAQSGDTIMLENGRTFTGTGNTQITISKNLIFDVLEGGTATIDGGGTRWGFTISSGTSVTFNNIIFQNLLRTDSNGGAIQNAGTLTLNNCNFTNNKASRTTGNTDVYGGAIYSTGPLTVNNCNFTGNTLTSGSNNEGYGGAIYCTGTLIITGSNFINNSVNSATGTRTDDGGAIYSTGTLSVTNCAFSGNNARDGGAIWSSNTLTVANSNFVTNTATRNGGAIYNSAGNSNITGSNFERNTAQTGNNHGSAIYNNGGNAEIHFNRIVNNTSTNTQIHRAAGAVNIINNWWGDNTGSTGRVSGTVTATTWLVLTITADPTTIPASGTSTITADLLHDSSTGHTYHDPSLGHVPDGILVAFTLNPSTIGSLSSYSGTTTDGSAVTIFTGNSNSGTATVSATVDNAVQSAAITVMRTDVYVSTTGSDTTGDGSQTRPYATILTAYNNVYSGGTIHVLSGSYTTTNIAINKNVNLIGEGGTVTIRTSNTNTPVITINSGGSGSTIQGFTIRGATGTTQGYGIYLNGASNCDVSGNNITGNYNGIVVNGGTGNNISDNNIYSNTNVGIRLMTGTTILANNSIYSNTNNGILIDGGTNTITGNQLYSNGGASGSGNPGVLINNGVNTISNNSIHDGADDAIRIPGGTNTITGNDLYNSEDGIDVEGGNNTITGNNIHNNREDGIHIDSVGTGLQIHFNRIFGNSQYGIHMELDSGTSTVNAENNWWGHNTAPAQGSGYGSDYYNYRGTVDANPWLILTMSANPNSIRRNGTSTVTAYLIYNSDGVDTSNMGHLPDGITVTFGNDSLGTVNPTTNTTIDSQANSVFTAKNTPGVARVSARVDNIIIYTDIIIGNIGNFTINNTIAYDDSVSYLYDTGLFHITVHNNGPDDATGVKVTVTIPSGFQLLAVNPIVGTYDLNTNTWTIGNISYNGTACLDLLLKAIQSGTSLTVTANVTGNEEGADAIVSKTVNILRAADLQVTQTVTNTTPNTGSNITFTVTVKNNGPDSANNITIYYKPPVGLSIISIIPSVGSYNSTTGLWTINTLAWNGTATLTITATVTASSGTVIKNTAKVNRVNEIDFSYNSENTTNICVSGTSYTPKIDLEIYNYYYNYDQDSINGTVQRKLKDTAMFYVDLKNNGPDDATGVKVTLTIPAGYQLLAVNPKIGTFDALTNTWFVGNLCSGGWASFDYILKVIQSNTTLNTTANATATETDTNLSNNGASEIIQVPPAADLNVNQTVNNTHPSTGSTVNYTITVTNNGPNTINNITLKELLPSTYFNNITSSATTGSYNSTTGIWNIGTLGAGATATLTITANVTASNGTIIKTNATLTNGFEMDYNLTDQEKETIIQVLNP